MISATILESASHPFHASHGCRKFYCVHGDVVVFLISEQLFCDSVACCYMLLSCLSVYVSVVFASVGAFFVNLSMALGSIASCCLFTNVIVGDASVHLISKC